MSSFRVITEMTVNSTYAVAPYCDGAIVVQTMFGFRYVGARNGGYIRACHEARHVAFVDACAVKGKPFPRHSAAPGGELSLSLSLSETSTSSVSTFSPVSQQFRPLVLLRPSVFRSIQMPTTSPRHDEFQVPVPPLQLRIVAGSFLLHICTDIKESQAVNIFRSGGESSTSYTHCLSTPP